MKLIISILFITFLVSCCVSQERIDKNKKMVEHFDALTIGSIFLESTWNKPDAGFTTKLIKKTAEYSKYNLTIWNMMDAENELYFITTNSENAITSIESKW